MVTDKESQNVFHCHACQRPVHYGCCGLPLFQIHHFLHTNNYRKFVCESCTKVAEHLKAVIPVPPPADQSKEVLELQETVKNKQLEVDTLSETNRILNAKIKELTIENSRIKRDQKEAKDKAVKTYKDKISSLQKSIAEREAAGNITSGEDSSIAALTHLIEKKFEQVENNLKKSILAEVDKSNKQMEEKLSEVVQTNKSYVDAVKNAENNGTLIREELPVEKTPDLRAIMRDERNEQLADEAEKKHRACNFVIHGFTEGTGDNAACKQFDNNAVTSLLAELGVNVTFKATYRLGSKATEIQAQSKRPIKVVMSNENDKDQVMSSLKNLKDKENYKGISITDDYTTKERDMIREWVKKAEATNANEPVDSEFVWKARGTPKNGMVMKKFRKRSLQNQTQ